MATHFITLTRHFDSLGAKQETVTVNPRFIVALESKHRDNRAYTVVHLTHGITYHVEESQERIIDMARTISLH